MTRTDALLVIWNPSSASADRAEQVYQELARWPDVRVERPESEEEADQLISELPDDAVAVIAAGGDGTVRRTISSLMRRESPLPLGVLPLGSGNDMARTLEIPFDPHQSLEVIRQGTTRPLDILVFRRGEHVDYCGNMLTGGNTGRYTEVMTAELKERWGAFCYLRGVVDVVQSLEAFNVTIACDDQPPESFHLLNLFLANGRTSGGGMVVSPEAELDDGLIDLVIVQEGDAGAIAGLTAAYFLSDYKNHELITFRRARRISLTSTPDLPMTADGDSIGSGDLEVTLRPQALRVLAPQSIPAR